MKKQKFLSGLLTTVLMLLATGCSDYDELQPSSNGSVEINVASTIGEIGDNATRAALAADMKTPIWVDDDKIGVTVDDGDASELCLKEGAGTANGTFSGSVAASGSKMYFYYPSWVAGNNGVVDIHGYNFNFKNKMVMFASADYSTKPEIKFQNKTSILKFSIPVQYESGYQYTAILLGAYTKGKLTKDGTWTDLEKEDMYLEDIQIIDGKVTGYAVVIPGSKVSDLRIVVEKYNSKNPIESCVGYVTSKYTNEDAVIPENSVITINKAADKKVLIWRCYNSSEDAVKDYFAKNGNDLTVVGWNIHDYEWGYFRNALKGKSNVNLTMLNLKDTEYGAFDGITALKSFSAPQLKSISERAFSQCTNLTSVDVPEVTSVGDNAFFYCNSLESISLPKATSVGGYAFVKSGLTTINLPQVTTVGDRAFTYCNSLFLVNLSKATNLGKDLFDSSNTAVATLYAPAESSLWTDYMWNVDWTRNHPVITNLSNFCTNDNYAKFRDLSNYLYIDFSNITQEEVQTYLQSNYATYFKYANTLYIIGKDLTQSKILQDNPKIWMVLGEELTSLPQSAFENCKSLGYVCFPNVETVGRYCFKRCSNISEIWLPNLKALTQQFLFGVTGLKKACFASLTDFTDADNSIEASIELALGSLYKFKFADGKNPLVIFRDGNTSLAAGTTLYLNEKGYEYKNNVSGNKWRGVTFKEIKKYSEYTGTKK